MNTQSEAELTSRLRLIRSGLSPATMIDLVHKLSSTEAIFNASTSQLLGNGLNAKQIQQLQQQPIDEVTRDLAWLSKASHGILFFDDAAYPAPLLTLSEPPFALFYIGDIDYLKQPQLAMVGSRNATKVGLQTATDFASHLSNAGITITSGLAHGIDAASHKGALDGIAGSIAVVANGLHNIYPKANTQLAAAIAGDGCIISESAVGTEPHKYLFPRRNRIISGLSLGTLVVEAALKSGSLITSRHAMEQGKEVFAIPGSIHNPLSRGCHQLIKSGAKLVESASDILEELLPLVNSAAIRHTSDPEACTSEETDCSEELDPAYLILLKHMEFEPIGIDEMVERSNLGAAEIASMLLILELQGQVVSQNGLYSRTAG